MTIHLADRGTPIIAVEPGSPADAAGVRPGDRLFQVEGHEPQDVIDYTYLTADDRFELTLNRDGRPLDLQLETGGRDPGLRFAEELFNGMRPCRNGCPFCFVDQLPPGLRPSLYVKDDDYRLSFLHGNFTTLNDIGARELERIVVQRLSPLYVSLQAWEPALRTAIMGTSAARGLENLKALDAAGIETHLQVVLCPGLNDAPAIDATVEGVLLAMDHCLSIGFVPVSAPAGNPSLRPLTAQEMSDALERVEKWQGRFREALGINLVYAADELYLGAGREVPAAGQYDGYPQYENGIGIVRDFIERVSEECRTSGAGSAGQGQVGLVTGSLASPILRELAPGLERAGGRHLEVVTVANALLGGHVTASGLMAGRDVLTALNASSAEAFLIPDCALREGRFIDDMTLQEAEDGCGRSCRAAAADGSGLVEALRQLP